MGSVDETCPAVSVVGSTVVACEASRSSGVSRTSGDWYTSVDRVLLEGVPAAHCQEKSGGSEWCGSVGTEGVTSVTQGMVRVGGVEKKAADAARPHDPCV